MLALAVVIASAPIVCALYAYVAYPLAVAAFSATRRAAYVAPTDTNWPEVTITLPVYNAASTIRAALERLLDLDYPREKLQLLVMSDASDDGTDDVVRSFADRGIELLRAATRQGKTAAENAAVAVARGQIIVNIDATVLVPASSLKPLIRAFDDPTVGVASGCDVSVGSAGKSGMGGETRYTGYEMRVRDFETRAGSIVGASGCFYGIRRVIRAASSLPPGLSWDFASTLLARRQRYRSVSVREAICVVPRGREIGPELKRKTRTMARGLRTLFYFRDLMNPFKYGGFSLMLVSHKLFRWIPYLIWPASIVALAILAAKSSVAAMLLGLITLGAVIGGAAIRTNFLRSFKPFAGAAFVVAAVCAGFLAWVDAFRGASMATWDPTTRPSVTHAAIKERSRSKSRVAGVQRKRGRFAQDELV